MGLMDEMKDKAEALKDKGEALVDQAKAKLDKDGDGDVDVKDLKDAAADLKDVAAVSPTRPRAPSRRTDQRPRAAGSTVCRTRIARHDGAGTAHRRPASSARPGGVWTEAGQRFLVVFLTVVAGRAAGRVPAAAFGERASCEGA